MAKQTEKPTISFQTHPDRYVHWKLSVDGKVARAVLDVQEDRPLRPGYVLKMNSYDLGVDIELQDILQRIRFEHPEVRCLIVTSAKDRIFCAGANINMLASSTHAFKVNFCKYTNETRLALEEMSAESGVSSIAAINGTCAGGGYELAMACDELVLIDDGNSSVGLPEVPLLGVLPGTGGLTRVTDKRMVRRDRADVFSTLTEGIKGKRAVSWRLVDRLAPRSRFDDLVSERAAEMVKEAEAAHPGRTEPGIELPPVEADVTEDRFSYRHVEVVFKREDRLAEITVRGPEGDVPGSHDDLIRAGADLWAIRAFREFEDAILRLRFEEPEIGLWLLHARGDADAVQAFDEALLALQPDSWLAREALLQMRRTLKRLDLSARTTFALVDEGSCFVGTLLELALSSDRTYMLEQEGVTIATSPINDGALPMSNGLSRLATRFWGHPAETEAVREHQGPMDAATAEELGLVTAALDDIDWEDEVRLAIEERASLSPDALTGMEANLRFPGPETLETKIFARLSAWQNWIFQRPNAVGERGALTMYGHPERPQFDWNRT